MRISNGNNPHIYQQKKTSAKHGSPTPTKENKNQDGFTIRYDELTLVKRQGTQVKLTSEEVATEEVTEAVAGNYPEGMALFSEMGTCSLENQPDPIKITAPPPKYPESIHDLSLGEIYAESSAAGKACIYDFHDSTGMTESEIYERVKSIFTEYLGKDFLIAQTALKLYANGSFPNNASLEAYYHVCISFKSGLENHGVDFNI